MFFISDAMAQTAGAAAAGGTGGLLMQDHSDFCCVLVLPDPSAAKAPEGTSEDVRSAHQGR